MARHESAVDLWPLLRSELIGTAVLVGVGLSVVILIFGDGSPVAQAIPNLTARRVLSGALFGGVGGLIAVSPVGVISGAHINPAVTLGFWLMGKLRTRVAVGYSRIEVAKLYYFDRDRGGLFHLMRRKAQPTGGG